ncbi:MAG: TRAP transporter large permease [Oscillospiraceae bacterium]|nr:TRAP transporter large permease [Oscillospiraceae bacterium]
MSLTMIAILGVCVMIALILMGMNVGMSMVLVGFAGLLAVKGWTGALGFLRQVPATQAMTYSFTVIPMFVLMGNAVFRSGISDGLFDASRKWLSCVPGNLACASVVASAIFGAICGSTIATTATIGTVALPKMREAGYSEKLAAGVICIGGGIGIMIPPSTPMIIYGVATENSIGELFAAGILPGILMAVLYILTIIIMVKLDPSLAPVSTKCSWAERFKSLRHLVGIVILFLIVLGGLFSGIFTVNEAAAIGALASLVLMFFRHSFTWRNFYNVIMDTITTSGMVLLLVIGASVFGSFLTVTKLPTTLASWLTGLDVSRYVVLLLLIVIYFILGMIMDELPMVLLTIPIFYPVITSLGFDSIWFGVIIILVTALGNITPPVGVCCFVLSGIAKDIPLTTIFRGIWPFVMVLLLTIVILTIFPSIATWLPSLLYA